MIEGSDAGESSGADETIRTGYSTLGSVRLRAEQDRGLFFLDWKGMYAHNQVDFRIRILLSFLSFSMNNIRFP